MMAHFGFASSFLLYIGGVVLLAALPLRFAKVKPNSWYGIRFAQSYQSERHWMLINRYGARMLMRWALATLGVGVWLMYLQDVKPMISLVFALTYPFTITLPIVLTYRYARALESSLAGTESTAQSSSEGRSE